MINFKLQTQRIDLPSGGLTNEVVENLIYLDKNYKKCKSISIVSFNFSVLTSNPPALVSKPNDISINNSENIIIDVIPENNFIPFNKIRSLAPYKFNTNIDINGSPINCKIYLNDDTVVLPFIGIIPYYFIFELVK